MINTVPIMLNLNFYLHFLHDGIFVCSLILYSWKVIITFGFNIFRDFFFFLLFYNYGQNEEYRQYIKKGSDSENMIEDNLKLCIEIYLQPQCWLSVTYSSSHSTYLTYTLSRYRIMSSFRRPIAYQTIYSAQEHKSPLLQTHMNIFKWWQLFRSPFRKGPTWSKWKKSRSRIIW